MPRVLFVDDEPSILAGFARNLRRRFRVTTAESGAEGLRLIEEAGGHPFEVIVSDMRMPGMDGAAFLKAVRRTSPSSVRVLLTGQADATSAAAAVNDGQIFRFLFKPCSTETLQEVLDECVATFRMRRAEQELLDKTLRASIRALVDVLSLSDPETFARVTRLRDTVTQLITATKQHDSWAVDVAAMLCLVGSAALPRALTQKINDGAVLSEAETAAAAGITQYSLKLIEHIPRLDAVRTIIANYQHHDYRSAGEGTVVSAGCGMLRLAHDLDAAERRGGDRERVLAQLADRGLYDPRYIVALRQAAARDQRNGTVTLIALQPGMVVSEDVKTRTGALLVSKGYVVNATMIARLIERAERGDIDPDLQVRVRGGAS